MKKPFALQVHEFLAQSAPIDGVSIGRKDDRSTWRVDFSDSATAAQKKAAKQSMASFILSNDDVKTAFDLLSDRVTMLEGSAKL